MILQVEQKYSARLGKSRSEWRERREERRRGMEGDRRTKVGWRRTLGQQCETFCVCGETKKNRRAARVGLITMHSELQG